MKAIFINEDNGLAFAHWIAERKKLYETRTKNTLLPCVGERVALCSTRHGKAPEIVGYADIVNYFFCNSYLFEMYRAETMIPKDSKYNKFGTRDGIPGKWFYEMANAETCKPHPLPSSAIRHGRSWCEF